MARAFSNVRFVKPVGPVRRRVFLGFSRVTGFSQSATARASKWNEFSRRACAATVTFVTFRAENEAVEWQGTTNALDEWRCTHTHTADTRASSLVTLCEKVKSDDSMKCHVLYDKEEGCVLFLFVRKYKKFYETSFILNFSLLSANEKIAAEEMY